MQFVYGRKQIALMADEKSPARISRRFLVINRSEMRINMFKEIKGLKMKELVNDSKATNIADILVAEKDNATNTTQEYSTETGKDFEFERD